MIHLQKQEAQLMLTNPCDAFTGQSRPSNILPFHTLGIVASCAIVTLSLKYAPFFRHSSSKNVVTLKSGSRVHSRSLKVVQFDRLLMISYYCSIETLSLRYSIRYVPEIFDFENAVTFKTGLWVTQGHWKCRHVIEHIWLPIDVL